MIKQGLVFVAVFVAICSVTTLLAQETAAPPAKMIARIWHGRTKAARADEYSAYLNEAGIAKIKAIEGNRGVQVFRRTEGEVTEFTVISFWDSIDAIKKFAGNDYEKTHNLPRDPEFLLELEPTVKHAEVLTNDWTH